MDVLSTTPDCLEPEILAVLGRDLDPVVRRPVAAHEATP